MAFDVITHGGGEGLVYVFNAVASIFNGKRALGASIVYIGSSFATAIAMMTMVAKQELLPTTKWFFGSLIITSALMLPKVDVIVKDRITKLERPVANVPFMLGAFAGIASQLGDVLAKQMDAIFSKAGPDYTGNGVAMASQLLSKVNHFHIRDPLMSANVRAFVQQCMVFDIAKGKYTIKELHRSDDIWKLLKDNASKARGFVYKSINEQKSGNKSVKANILTCEEGANKLEEAWNEAYKQAALAYGPRLYPSASNPAKLFMENLPLAHHYLTKLSNTAESILQQSMISNAIDDGLLELNQMTDANAAVTAYATKRAQAQQRVAYSLQGNMASLSLSVLKVVVEILFYGLFPIIVAISIFPGGWTIIKKYIIALFWIQSWAPMYAILNMIMNVYGKTKSVAAVSTVGKGMLNMYALRGLNDANEWISSVAGYAMMSVPFLSYGIIHYGAGALSQLSTHFGSVTQSAAGHAAEEATTGNYSMGNTSFDNHNRSNMHGFKYDTNMNVATGRTTFQQEDGALLSMNRNQTSVMDMNHAISNLGGQVKVSESLASSYNESANESMQMGIRESQSAAKSISSAFNTLDEYRKNRSTDINASTSFSQQEQAFKETAFNKYDKLVEEFAKSNHIDKRIANDMFASIGGSIPGTKIGGGISISRQIANTDTLRKAETYSDEHNMTELLRQSISEAKEGRLNLSNSEGKNYGESISSSLNKAESQIQSAETHFNKAQSYQKQAAWTEHNSVSIDQNYTQKYWNSLEDNIGTEEAKHVVANPEVNHQYQKQFVADTVKELRARYDKQTIANPNLMYEQYENNSRNLIESNSIENSHVRNKELVLAKSEKEGLTKPVESNMKEIVENGLKGTHQEIEDRRKEISERKEKLQAEKLTNNLSQTSGIYDILD